MSLPSSGRVDRGLGRGPGGETRPKWPHRPRFAKGPPFAPSPKTGRDRLLMSEVFASSPFIVGESAPPPAEPFIPAEESLCPVISHRWVNEQYKHLVVTASEKALAVKPGQFFNLLCPSPDAGELWLRRPQSVYRIDRAGGRIEFLYKCVGRGTHGLATLKKGDMLNMVGPLGVGFHLDPSWRNIVV